MPPRALRSRQHAAAAADCTRCHEIYATAIIRRDAAPRDAASHMIRLCRCLRRYLIYRRRRRALPPLPLMPLPCRQRYAGAVRTRCRRRYFATPPLLPPSCLPRYPDAAAVLPPAMSPPRAARCFRRYARAPTPRRCRHALHADAAIRARGAAELRYALLRVAFFFYLPLPPLPPPYAVFAFCAPRRGAFMLRC